MDFAALPTRAYGSILAAEASGHPWPAALVGFNDLLELGERDEPQCILVSSLPAPVCVVMLKAACADYLVRRYALQARHQQFPVKQRLSLPRHLLQSPRRHLHSRLP